MAEIADPQEKWTEWVRAGLITEEQVRAIGAYEQARTAPLPAAAPTVPDRATAVRSMQGAVPEALGYLGGLLILGGSVAFLSRVWDSVPLAGRVGIAAVAAVLLGIGGGFVDERSGAALARLRAVLWTASTAASGIAVGLIADQVFTDPRGHSVVLLVGLTVGLQAGLMWSGRDRPAQLAAYVAAWPVVLGSASAHLLSGAGQGIVIWLVGVGLLWLGLYRVTRREVLWVLAGAISAMVGAGFVASGHEGIGLGFALATALGLLVLGVGRGLVEQTGPRLALSITGALATLQLTPASIGYFAQEAGLLTGAVMWSIGGAAMAGMQRLRIPRVAETLGAAVMVGGAAVMAAQVTWVALVAGLCTSVGLLAIGARPERVAASLVGSGGLLIFVPWSISHFFPGQGRVPLLVTVTGLLILAVAISLLRRRPRSTLGSGAAT